MQRHVNDWSSAALAVFLAPLAVVPIVTFAFASGLTATREESLAASFALSVLVALPLTFLVVLLVGYPGYKVLLKLKLLNAWTLCLFGAGVAGVGGVVLVG